MELRDVKTRMGGVTLNAVSLPYAARQEGWNCYENISLTDLLKIGAKEMGLKGVKLYGVKGETVLRRVVRRGQTWPRVSCTCVEAGKRDHQTFRRVSACD